MMHAWYAWMDSAWAKTLGWSLIHFLWQGAAIALLLAAVLRFTRTEAARFRYACCCLALLAMPVSLAITAYILQPHAMGPVPAHALVLPPAPDPSAGDGIAGTVSSGVWPGLPWVAPLWMAGVLLFYLRSVVSWLAAQRLRRTGVCAAASEWQERLARLGARMGLRRQVELLESCRVDVPVVMGVLRPVILMPMGLLAGLSTGQMESILIHELAHIRRGDYAINLLQCLVEGLLFYHPAAWWVSAQIRAERENCCDDVAVALGGNARGYAAALARLEQSRWPASELAMAASGGSLMKRIRRLLREPEGPRVSTAPAFAAVILVVSVGVAVAGWESKPAAVPQATAGPLPSPVSNAVTAHPLAVQPRLVAAAPLVEQVQAVQDPVPLATPLTEAQRQKQQEKLSKETDSPYRKWLNDDVAYIISDQERSAFKQLQTDQDREQFITTFWLRRDPTPGTAENEMREEHYRRIAYTNEHYSSSIPGWKTDRGRIYITYGPPDEIESHPAGGTYQRPAAEGGGTTVTYPFEKWRYRYIDGVGNDIIIEFVDEKGDGEYHMSADPSSKDALLYVPQNAPIPVPGTSMRQATPRQPGTTFQVMGTGVGDQRTVLINIPLSAYGDHQVDVIGRVTTMTRRPVQNFQMRLQGPLPTSMKFVALPPGTYRLNIVLRDVTTGAQVVDELPMEVK